MPEACARLYALMQRDECGAARRLQRQLLPLARLISSGYGVPGLKAALILSGVDVGFPRLPLVPVSPQGTADLQRALHLFEESFA
jgi:dihydrodipicolinate synthase/N-acetylneuraminate lyase